MITKTRYIHEIVVKLSVLRYVVESDARKGFYDIPKACEDLFMEIFNIVYETKNLKFQNMNDEQTNYPAVDLGDLKRKTGVQITCQNDSAKIQDTLDTFENSQLDLPKKFKHLFVFLLTRKPNYSKKFFFPSGKRYSKKHILSIDDFVDNLDNLDLDVLERLNIYLAKNVKLCVDSSSPTYQSLAKNFPEFGSRKYTTLNKLGLRVPDEEVDEIFKRIDGLPLEYRLVFFTFISKSYENDLEMGALVLESFARSQKVRDLEVLFNGPLALLKSNDAEPRRFEKISLMFEDTWRLILEKVDEQWWEQLIVYADFTLLD